MIQLLRPATGMALTLGTGVAWAQGGGMMYGDHWGTGWMGGFGGGWVPILLVVVVGLLIWLVVQKRK
jgi:hypothetical protein